VPVFVPLDSTGRLKPKTKEKKLVADVKVQCELIAQLKSWFCKLYGHEFDYDQCGYWQHKYCEMCGDSQYPDLAKKSCNELNREMGKITEKEWINEINLQK
jgi:hypothetical protein